MGELLVSALRSHRYRKKYRPAATITDPMTTILTMTSVSMVGSYPRPAGFRNGKNPDENSGGGQFSILAMGLFQKPPCHYPLPRLCLICANPTPPVIRQGPVACHSRTRGNPALRINEPMSKTPLRGLAKIPTQNSLATTALSGFSRARE